jgi:hypothetical protein
MGIRVPDIVKRHRWKLAVAGAVFLALAIPSGIYGHWAYEGSPQFCASCHIMDEAHATWERSAHKVVGCKECHTQDLFGRMRLGWQFVIDRPKEVGPHARLDEAVCKRCHDGAGKGTGDTGALASIAGTPGHRVHHERARLACLECHSRKLHVFEPDVGRCRECHTERVNLPKMRDALAHEKGGNDCLACHKFLEKGQEALAPDRGTCASCHEKQTVVAILDKGEAKGKPFHAECRDCHAVHGRAFQDPVDCLRCHVKVLNDKAHIDDGRLQEKCTECHEPHRWKIE